MITKKVVRARNADDDKGFKRGSSIRIDDEPPVVGGRYIHRETGEPLDNDDGLPRSISELSGEVRIDRRLLATFVVGFIFVTVVLLSVGYIVGRERAMQLSRTVAELDRNRTAVVAAPDVAARPVGTGNGAANGPNQGAGSEATSDAASAPLSFYEELAKARPGSALGTFNETDPAKFHARVQAEAVVTPKVADPADRGLFTIQVSAFKESERAGQLADTLRESEYPSYVVAAEVADRTWHRVRVGQFTSRSEAERMAERIRNAEGYPAYVTKSDT